MWGQLERIHLKFCTISCESLAREAARAAANSPHVVDLSLVPFGLHNEPNRLRAHVQERIDEASAEGGYDFILLAYGLCSRGTADLQARSIPIVIPRAHDCITLFLGSRDRYAEEFSKNPGTYYYSAGWVERRDETVRQGTMGMVHDSGIEERFKEYLEKYGEDNARYLMEQENQWLENYNRAAFIDVGLGDVESYRRYARQIADSKGWTYEEIAGDTRLIDNLLSGVWNPDEYLIVKPGEKTVEDINSGIITAVETTG